MDRQAAPPKLKFLDTALTMLAVGVGIRWIAVAAAVGPASLPLWLLAMLVFFVPLCVATAELAGRHEGEGGIYLWARDGIGPLAGFICGWLYWISLMPYFAGILYFLSGLAIGAVGGDPKDTLLYISISVAISLLVTAIQIAGLKYGKWPPNIGTVGGWIVVLIIVGMGAVLGAEGKGATDFLHARYIAPFNFDTAILWGTIVFAYSGMETAGMLRNEIEGGMRTILRVLTIVGLGSLFVYVAGTSAFLTILPQTALTRLGGFSDALLTGLDHVGLGRFAPVVLGLFALSMLGSFVAWFGVGARLPFAAGIDSYLPPLFAQRNARTGAPVPAILLQAALMIGIVILSQAGSSVAGAYDFLVATSVLGATTPYLFMFWAHIKSAGLPPVEGAWVPPGGRRTTLVMGWLGMASCTVAIGCTMVPSSSDPNPLAAFLKIVIAGAAMIGMGLLVYWNAARRRKLAARAVAAAT
ncbi:MAG TPA: APC family permease [Rhizomicrobium sp.]|jgi:amino acid transporter|nr:APC family permease [Rhizomicrobium sp.]